MTTTLAATLLGAGLLAASIAPGVAAPKADDPLAALRGKSRIVVAVAPSRSDPKLAKQRAIFADMHAGAKERDLVLFEAVGATREADALRRIYDLGPGFQAVLVGKDGGGKLTSADPLGPDQLFPLIDSMPMRQEEMNQR